MAGQRQLFETIEKGLGRARGETEDGAGAGKEDGAGGGRTVSWPDQKAPRALPVASDSSITLKTYRKCQTKNLSVAAALLHAFCWL